MKVMILGSNYLELLYELLIHRVGEVEVRQTHLQRTASIWLQHVCVFFLKYKNSW
jgi:hypothetical protein